MIAVNICPFVLIAIIREKDVSIAERKQMQPVRNARHIYACHTKRNGFIPYHGESSDSDNADIDSDNVDSGSNHAARGSNHVDSDSNDADSESNPVDSDPNIDEQQSEENASASESPDI